MLKITRFMMEGKNGFQVSDEPNPRFHYALSSDQPDTAIRKATLFLNGSEIDAIEQTAVIYKGQRLEAYKAYTARLEVEDNHGEKAEATYSFEMGKLDEPWQGKWISDPTYSFTEKGVSPKPMLFQKKFSFEKKVSNIKVYSTALGVYDLLLDGKKVGEQIMAPGFTSYKHHLQYQVNELPAKQEFTLGAIVAGGWAVGSFVFTRGNRYDGDRQALLLELRVTYEDGSVETFGSDASFEVTTDSAYQMADLYDGETYDATVEPKFHPAALETLRINPKIYAEIGCPILPHEHFKPLSHSKSPKGVEIYDFGQNFAGVVHLHIKTAQKGQKIVVKHAEILEDDGELCLSLLRTAKATSTYICLEGEQDFTPTLTYMGFRYVGIEGILPEDVEIEGIAYYSDLEQVGEFSCSNEMLNRLQKNIEWSSKSNLVDIPTDCPQRDERMGWTGDISIFAPTASYNFKMSRFLKKWLKDVRAEQLKTGGLPNTVPVQSYGFPATMPKMAIDFWGDAILNVPYAVYRAEGDVDVLKDNYESMKKYVNACSFWAKIWGVGKYRYIWHTPALFHFGDWVAPDAPKMSQWQARSRYTATASIVHTSGLLSKIARILGKEDDAKHYENLSKKTADAYTSIFMKEGILKKKPFQTGYVLPLAFGMLEGKDKENALNALVELIEKNDYKIGTGFPGTGHILFALADNGRPDVAYKMLLNVNPPSWLYEVKAGGTTIWEKFDGLDENGHLKPSTDGTDNMISFNHYASGSVGEFFYRRIAGLEIVEPGYKKFRVKPLLNDEISFAKTKTETPYGPIEVSFEKKGKEFSLTVDAPVGTLGEIVLPSGKSEELRGGKKTFTCTL